MALHGRMAAAAVSALLALSACSEERGGSARRADDDGLRADFTARGAFVSPSTGAGWSFRATPWAFGCDGALAPLGETAPEIHGDRTVYARPGLDEWYVRGPRGVEQGFTLPAPPACRRAGGEGVVIALGGGLGAVVDEGGRGARLRDAAGREVLRYADLHVVDAAGRELPASIEARSEGLAIRFDDRGAAYPVVVDPMMWKEQQVLREPDAGINDDAFGAAIALSGDTLLVGAPGNGGSGKGAAYVFVRSGAHWSLQQTLVASDAMIGGSFGDAVALQGDTAVVGAFQQGAAYVFTRTGTTWAQTQELDTCAPQMGSFGEAVALDGDTLVVGVETAACVYVLAGGTWTLQQALTDASAGQSFGSSVAVSGDTAIVGAPLESTPGGADVFVRASGTWTLQQQLVPSGDPNIVEFGNIVAVEGDTAIANSLDGPVVFSRTGAVWTQTQLVVPEPPLMVFGGMSLNGGTLAGCGVSGDMVELETFAPDGGSLTFQQTLFVGDSPSGEPFSVAMDGTTTVVGAQATGEAFVIALQSSDGEPCTSPESCLSGFCVDGACCGVPSCPPVGPCNAAEHCQPGTGTCSSTPIHEGMSCPSDACTPDAVCRSGTCSGNVKVCAPADECHEFGACDPSNGQCSTPAKPDGTPCSGGKTCVGGLCGGPQAPTPSAKGCACDVGGGAPAGGAVIAGIALALLQRRRRGR